LGLVNLTPLLHSFSVNVYQIAVYCPEESLERITEAVFQAGAGTIGSYGNCCNTYPVDGQFKPSEGSNPTVGSINKLEKVHEIKLEFFADSTNLDKVIETVIATHPYETPVYAVYPLKQKSRGMGYIGQLPQAMSLKKLAQYTKQQLGAPFVKLWLSDKSLETIVKSVAVCGGSGSSFINQAKSAEVYISGDFTYHAILESPLPLIDAGHFYTEQPVLAVLKKILSPKSSEIALYTREEHEISRLRLY
ncbi:MAG: Nif3-like dinuclear metal center hexameric protein, partial [Candidatus Cloacimonetes bacterium]|nr:Nif3-like dinuclear metal center hexameric protein [Candidatus Cloacimonadota bacterium]